MITIAIAALVVGLWLHHRALNTQRDDFQTQLSAQHDRHAQNLQRVLAQKNPDLEQLIALIDRQMQRIQAPAQAVMDHSVGLAAPSPPAIPFDDDDAFNESRQMSKEDLAEHLMRAEVTSDVA